MLFDKRGGVFCYWTPPLGTQSVCLFFRVTKALGVFVEIVTCRSRMASTAYCLYAATCGHAACFTFRDI